MQTPTDVLLLLDRELASFIREIELFPDDESPWRTLPGVTNSAANLALHVAGNLQHYVGAVLDGSGYVRNRELEFGRRAGSRAQLVGELERARQAVRAGLTRLAPERLSEPFPEEVGGVSPPIGLFLLHLAVHLGFHLGQAGYLRRVITGDNRSTNPLSAKALAGDPRPEARGSSAGGPTRPATR
jgi:hypothetical protein